MRSFLRLLQFWGKKRQVREDIADVCSLMTSRKALDGSLAGASLWALLRDGTDVEV